MRLKSGFAEEILKGHKLCAEILVVDHASDCGGSCQDFFHALVEGGNGVGLVLEVVGVHVHLSEHLSLPNHHLVGVNELRNHWVSVL